MKTHHPNRLNLKKVKVPLHHYHKSTIPHLIWSFGGAHLTINFYAFNSFVFHTNEHEPLVKQSLW